MFKDITSNRNNNNNEDLLRQPLEDDNIEVLKKLAEEDCAEVQNYLSNYYMGWKGVVPFDAEKAMYWCKRGADNNNPDCIMNMASMSGANGDFGSAQEWLKKALSLGIWRAYSLLETCI